MPNPKIFLAALAASFALAATAPAPVMAQSAKPKVKKTVAAKSAKLGVKRAGTSICAPGQVRRAGRCATSQTGGASALRYPIILMPGQRFESAMPAMANPAAADLPPLGETATYYQIGNRVISVDNESRVILNVIEVAGG